MLHHPGSSSGFPIRRRVPVPAIPPYLIEPIWQQLLALLPERHTRTTLSVATDPVSPTVWSSRSLCRYWSSAAPTKR
jgi:hypothetical protein